MVVAGTTRLEHSPQLGWSYVSCCFSFLEGVVFQGWRFWVCRGWGKGGMLSALLFCAVVGCVPC